MLKRSKCTVEVSTRALLPLYMTTELTYIPVTCRISVTLFTVRIHSLSVTWVISDIGAFCGFTEEIAKNFKSALVHGTSAKHSRGQKVGLEHVLEDEE